MDRVCTLGPAISTTGGLDTTVRRDVVGVEFTADSLVSRAAHEVSLRADQLIHDMERSLQRGVPQVREALTSLA